MQKKLLAIGNSLALVIDRPIRDLLGIRRETAVRLSTDGRRLVIEPVVPSAEPPPSACELDAGQVFVSLVEQFLMTREQFRQLHHAGGSMGSYSGWLQFGFASEATSAEYATMQRLEACQRALRAGLSWDGAIAAALAACPLTGEQT